MGIVSILSVRALIRTIEMFLMRDHNVCFIQRWGIVFALSSVSPIFWSSVILVTRVWAGPVRLGLDTIHLFRCEDCLSHVPYQADAQTGMELVRDCPWCGLLWIVSWPALAGADHGRVNGVVVFFFFFCFLLDSACPLISFR